jgi:hypothetical protein
MHEDEREVWKGRGGKGVSRREKEYDRRRKGVVRRAAAAAVCCCCFCSSLPRPRVAVLL